MYHHVRFTHLHPQGLLEKEKVHVDCEKGVQISNLLSKIATQWWPNIIINESRQTIHYAYPLFPGSYVLINYYVADLLWFNL